MTGELTHFDEAGRAVMVDVGEKPLSARVATARSNRDESRNLASLIGTSGGMF